MQRDFSKRNSSTDRSSTGTGNARRRDWFEKVFGFVERDHDYDGVKNQFHVTGSTDIARPSIVTLKSKRSGETFQAGKFQVTALRELRRQTSAIAGKKAENRVSHIAVGDILELHHQYPNAVFQVASQFNTLEMVDPDVSPESGVTMYQNDATQGPACALACAPGTLVRNYFVEFPGSESGGQRRHTQIDTMYHIRDKFRRTDDSYKSAFVFQNGYVFASSQTELEHVNAKLRESDQELFSVGVHEDTQVVFDSRWERSSGTKTVTQVFCSAIPVSYDENIPPRSWAPVAKMCLRAMYEATLREAIVEGKKDVFLTFLGGGAFGNNMEWITDAINHALETCKKSGLNVYICHYKSVDNRVRSQISSGKAAPSPAQNVQQVPRRQVNTPDHRVVVTAPTAPIRRAQSPSSRNNTSFAPDPVSVREIGKEKAKAASSYSSEECGKTSRSRGLAGWRVMTVPQMKNYARILAGEQLVSGFTTLTTRHQMCGYIEYLHDRFGEDIKLIKEILG
jgi:hypothetical protein